MAEIQQYDSPLTSIHPTEIGVDAAAQTGRTINRIYTEEAATKNEQARQVSTGLSSTIRDVGTAAVDYVNYQDKSKISAAATNGLANVEQQLQQRLKGNGLSPDDPNYVAPADPNDPTVLSKFRDDVIQPFLDSLKKIPMGEAGQNYALDVSDQLAQHLSTQMTAEAGNLAAKGAVVRSEVTRNSVANMVQTTPTPDNIDLGIKLLTEHIGIEKSGGAITADAAAALDAHSQKQVTELVHTGIVSAVTKSATPSATAVDMLNRYKKYVTPEDETTITAVATTVEKAREADVKSQRTEALAKQKADALAQTSDYTQQYLQNPGAFSTDKMLTDPRYKDRPDLLKEGIGVIQTLREVRDKEADVNPLVSKSNALGLLQRMDLPEGDPRRLTDRSEIDQAFIGKQIGKTEWTELTDRLAKDAEGTDKLLANARSRFFKDNAMFIDGAGNGSTAFGKQQIFAAQQEAERMEGFIKAKGQDPQSLYDPASPNYFGKQLARFATTSRGKLVNPDASGYQITDPGVNHAALVIKNNLESAGDYGAISAASRDGDKAYGAYQVMGKNVGPWTKQYYGRALSPQEFLQNKEAQDMVFEGQFGQYMKKYGAEGAARAWYAGEKGMHNAAATDVYGKLTVEQYGRKFMAGVQGLPYVDAGLTPAAVMNKYPGKKIMRSDGTIWQVPEPPRIPLSK